MKTETTKYLIEWHTLNTNKARYIPRTSFRHTTYMEAIY